MVVAANRDTHPTSPVAGRGDAVEGAADICHLDKGDGDDDDEIREAS